MTDPWWTGPAYTNQWYPWPTPQPGGLEQRPIDYLFLSHGHEDHCHPDTLKTLQRGATALVPEYLSGSMEGFLRDELGFAHVIEMKHGETVQLRRGVKATCYINLTDSILVVDDGDRVLVNANDALHSSPPAVVDYFCRLLRENHPRIDTLYLGFSGASWFPNCLRLPNKDDREVGREREEVFLRNFLRIVDGLQPKIACAFAASFVLVEPQNRWINDVKFEVPTPDEAWEKERPKSGTRAHLLLPNDVVDGVEIIRGTTPRPTKARLAQAMKKELREGVERAQAKRRFTPAELETLAGSIELRLRDNLHKWKSDEHLSLAFKLREAPKSPIRVEIDRQQVHVSVGPALPAEVTIELRAEILEASLRDDYGIESIFIGYGAVATMERSELLDPMNTLLVMLSPRKNSWRGILNEVRRAPMRAVGALWRQRMPIVMTVGARLGLVTHLYEERHLGAPEAPGKAA